MSPDRKAPPTRLVSNGFLQAIFGILVTILAWFGPWSWPAWPARVVMSIAFTPERPFADLSYAARSAVVVGVITLNVACWGLAARFVVALRRKLRGNQDTGR